MRQPGWQILLDGGKNLPINVSRRVIKIRLTDERGMASDTLEVDLDDRDGRLPLPKTGTRLSVWIGWKGFGLWDKGQYIIDEIEHSGPPDILSIRARAATLRDTLKESRTESYDQITLQQLTEKIAARHQLQAIVGQNIASRLTEHLDQRDESDIHFITRIATEYDAMATIKENRLIVMQNGQGITANGTAMPRAIIKRHDGDSYRYLSQDRTGTTTGVIAKWRNKGAAIDEEILAGTEQNTKTLRRLYTNHDEAERAACGELNRIKRSAKSINITLAYGRVDLSTETPITLIGFKTGIDGEEWIANHIEHQLSEQGFLTTITIEPKTSGEPTQ